MNIKLKRRIAGASVFLIFILAVLLYFLHNAHSLKEFKPLQMQAPNIPTENFNTITDADKKLVSLDDKNFAQPQTEQASLQGSAWSIQLGSFNDQTNAINLVTQLRQANYVAYEKSYQTQDNTILYRVFVGPVLKREQAEKLLQQLKDNQQLSGLIVSFDPDN